MKKKVLLVFPGMRIKNDEGSKHRLNCHVNEYKKRGYDVDVLAICKDVKFGCDSKYLNPNANWIIRPYLFPFAKHIFFAKCLIVYLKIITAIHTWIKKYDVVQMELWGTQSCLCRKSSFYITDVHGDSVYELREMGKLQPWVADYFVEIQKDFVKHSDLCIFVSENLRRQIEINTNEKEKDYALISCGVDIKRFETAEKATIDGLDLSQRIVLGYCGGFHGWQNFEAMIDLAIRLHNMDKRVFLLVFSNGNVEPFNEKLSMLGKENYFIKGLPSKEVPSHLKLMDAGLLLRSDLILNRVSSPTKICEYLAAGVPLVCTQYSGDYDRSVVHKENGFVGAEPVFTDEEVKDLLVWLKGVKNSRQSFASKCITSVKNRTFEAEFDTLIAKVECN